MMEEDIGDENVRGDLLRDRQALKAWLNADSDVNSRGVDGQTLLGTCVLAAAASHSKYEARNHLEAARMLVACGARADALVKHGPNAPPLTRHGARLLQSPLVMPITSLNVAGTDEMYAWYDLLIGAGADPNSTSEVLVDGFRCRMSMLSRVCFFFPATALNTTEKRLALIKLLLRAGAATSPCATAGAGAGQRWVPTYDAIWALDDAVARAPNLADDEHCVAAKRLVEGVLAAGSYKKYLRLPLQELLNLLSLAQRGKLATTDPVMKALVGVDNHVVWNILSFWKETN